MRRRVAFVVAWFLVTGISVLIATQAVGTVRDQVTDSPATLSPDAANVLVAATSTALPPTTPPSETTTSTVSPSTTTTLPDLTTQPTTTEPARPTTSTSTAPPPTTTATTTSPPATEVATYQFTGGWVRIRYGGGDVVLVDAAPYAGFSMKIEKDGPDKVEVEFEGEDYEAEFKADMEDGPLDVDIDESDGEE